MAVGPVSTALTGSEIGHSDSEALAPLGTTRTKDGTAGARFHAHTKPVGTLATGN